MATLDPTDLARVVGGFEDAFRSCISRVSTTFRDGLKSDPDHAGRYAATYSSGVDRCQSERGH